MPTIHCFWDELEDNVVEEYDDNGNTIVNYTTEPTMYGSVLSQDRGGEIRHYQFDGLGNTTELTDRNSNVTDARRYSAFGDVTGFSGTAVFSFQWGGRFGYLREPATRRFGIRHRVYDTSSVRWMTKDPLGPGQTVTTYLFVAGDAVNRIDPSGLRYCQGACDPEMPPCTTELNRIINDAIQPFGTRATLIDRLSDLGKGSIRAKIEQIVEAALPQYCLGIASGTFDAPVMVLECMGERHCIGLDKIGHFLQQGLQYYEISLAVDEKYAFACGYWLEGLTPPGLFDDNGRPDAALLKWLRHPVNCGAWAFFTDYNILGRPQPGPGGKGGSSVADIAANEGGYQYIKDLLGGHATLLDICRFDISKWDHLRYPNVEGGRRGDQPPRFER